MFPAALLTIATTRKQPKCPLTGEWIKRWSIYAMEYYSAIKRMKMPFASLSEVSQRAKDKCQIGRASCRERV